MVLRIGEIGFQHDRRSQPFQRLSRVTGLIGGDAAQVQRVEIARLLFEDPPVERHRFPEPSATVQDKGLLQARVRLVNCAAGARRGALLRCNHARLHAVPDAVRLRRVFHQQRIYGSRCRRFFLADFSTLAQCTVQLAPITP